MTFSAAEAAEKKETRRKTAAWGVPQSPEGWVVRYADKIAYLHHDIDDAMRAGIVREEDLPQEIRVGAPTHEAVDNRVAARVVTVQFLGAFARLSLALPGDGGPELECDLAGDALADAGAKEGTELALVLTPEALRVFPEPT